MREQEKLPEAELEVMLCLWQHQQPVRTSVLAQMLAKKNWTLSTLKVLLGRLVEKGYAEVTRDGRFTLYRALVQESEYRSKETRGLLRRYYGNSVKRMVASLIEEQALSGEELEELEEILREAGGRDA